MQYRFAEGLSSSYVTLSFVGAKIRISEHKTKEKCIFSFCSVEREYLRHSQRYVLVSTKQKNYQFFMVSFSILD